MGETYRRVTLLDVAVQAGVSRAAASIVLRGRPGVSEPTRVRVLKAMEDLGYVYNRGAAMLRSASSKVVGVVVHDIANSFFAEMTQAIDAELTPHRYVILLGSTSDARDVQERVIRTMQEHQVDGVILSPADGTAAGDLRSLNGLPLILATRQVRGLAADYVGAENRQGGVLATRYLIELGHRRIAFVGGSVRSSSRRERLSGYRHELAAHHIRYDPVLDIPGAPTREGGRVAMEQALALHDPPTGVFCYSDAVAIGSMAAMTLQGRWPGRDIAVVGFDGIAEAAYQQPPLTTIAVSPWDIGRRAAQLLLTRMQDPSIQPRRVVLPATLVVRASCGPADTSASA